MYPVKLEVSPADITKSIIHVKEQLRKIPHKGIGYGALLGYTNPTLPRISFNYLGQFDVNDKQWGIVGEPSGIAIGAGNSQESFINVNGWVNQNELRFWIDAKISQKTVNQLAVDFKQQLLAVINHVSNLKRRYLTASDVNYVISQSYLDKIQVNTDISQVYLANSLQQGFIYHALHQEHDSAYRVQLSFNYNNALQPELLKMAWQGAITKYPSLRLRFAWEDILVQIVDQQQTIAWQYSDVSDQDIQRTRAID